MLFVSLRDLQWRRRRFLIGVLATGLVFALTVVMSGVDASFHNEINRVVNAFSADKWIVPADVSGPFTSTSVFAQDEVKKISSLPGVEAAEPVAFFRATVKTKQRQGPEPDRDHGGRDGRAEGGRGPRRTRAPATSSSTSPSG